jgi:hypothetical protein
MIEELFVPYNEAKSLEELGFKEDCLAEYCSDPYGGWDLVFPHHKRQTRFNPVDAPTYQQVFKWCWKQHSVGLNINMGNKLKVTITIEKIIKLDELDTPSSVLLCTEEKVYSTYEEYELESLKLIIEILQWKIKNNINK